MKKLLLSLCAVLSLATSYAQAPGFTAKMDSLMATLDVNKQSMCAIALTKNGHILYQKTIGQAVAGNGKNIPNTITTKFRIGSVTKMFTSVMIFQLIEGHKLTLDAKLSTYFPQIPNANDITIAQLLNHHSGIKNFTEVAEYDSLQTSTAAARNIIAFIAKQEPAFKPGEKAEYSNSNYALLARIIEKVTGHSYDDELQKRIAKKIGLKNTYNGKETTPNNGEALSYDYSDNSWEEHPATSPEWLKGAGGIVSTPADLDLFITALFNHKLVNDASLKTMTNMEDGYGSGLFVVPFDNLKGYGHTGSVDGYRSGVSYFPSDGVALSIIANGERYPMNNIAIGVLSTYYGRAYTIPSFQEATVSSAILDKYVGIYANKDFPLKITITRNGSSLMAQATGQSAFTLRTESETRFTFEDAGITLDFEKTSDPKFQKMTLHQGDDMVFVKEN